MTLGKGYDMKRYEEEEVFIFTVDMDMREVEEWVALAVVDAGMSMGQSKVRKDLQYSISPDDCMVVVDVSSEVGKHVAKILQALITQACNAEAYKKRMDAREGTKEIDWDKLKAR